MRHQFRRVLAHQHPFLEWGLTPTATHGLWARRFPSSREAAVEHCPLCWAILKTGLLWKQRIPLSSILQRWSTSFHWVWVSSFWIEISSLFVIETYSVTRKISHFFFVVSASARSESWRRCTLRMHTLLFSLVRALLFGTSCMQAWRSRLQLFFSGQQCCAHQHVIRQGIFLVAQVGSYFIFFSFTSTKGTLYLGKIVRCWGIVYTTKSCA